MIPSIHKRICRKSQFIIHINIRFSKFWCPGIFRHKHDISRRNLHNKFRIRRLICLRPAIFQYRRSLAAHISFYVLDFGIFMIKSLMGNRSILFNIG